MSHYGSRNTSQASQLSAEPHLQTHIAAFHNDVELLKRLLAENAPTLDDESMETPLHVAARCGSDLVVEWLIDNVAEFGPMSKAMNGSTPAHYAAIYGQLSTLKLLLQSGSELRNDVASEKDTQGLTVLHLASLKGDEQVVEYLVKNFERLVDMGNEAEDYPIHFAAASGHTSVVKAFVKLCGKEVASMEDTNGTLPVYFAAQEGKLRVLRYLINELGVDPIARDNDGLTTLHAATQGGHLDTVKWLMDELGEEFITDETQDGATPIHIAAAMGYPDILEWFFERKGGKKHVNVRDRNKRTPCHDAAEYGHMEALVVLLKYGASVNEKDNDGRTPLQLVKDNDEMSSLIRDYNEIGPQVLSQYLQQADDDDDDDDNVAAIYSEIDKPERKSSNRPVRTSRTEHVELASALSQMNEVQEYRLRRQESLQAIEDEINMDYTQEKSTQKRSKKSSTGPPQKHRKNEEFDDHYEAENGEIYARPRKPRHSRPGSAQDKKSSVSGNSGGIERKLSPPPHWYNGVAEDGHDNRSNYSRSRARRHEAEDDMSVYSYISSASRPHGAHSVQSGYSGHSMASAYRHGHFVPYPGAYPPYGGGYGGYPMYPGGYPMYPPHPGYRPPQPVMNSHRYPGNKGAPRKRQAPGRPPHSLAPPKDPKNAPKGRKSKSPSLDYSAFESKGEQMIGYGPDISDGLDKSKGKKEEADFHPPPPPITKGGHVKEFVTTEDQNFIMVKKTDQSLSTTVHPSGLRLNPSKQPFVYDGRWDKFIEPDEDGEEADPIYGVPVLAACAAILGIGVVTNLKGIARLGMINQTATTTTTTTKDREYESVAWDSTTYSSAQVGGKMQKRISTSSHHSLHGGLFDGEDDTEELDPIEYSLREEGGLTKTTTTTTEKSKYRSATLPSKRKTALQQIDFADDNFAKMTPDYGEATGSREQVGGGLGESLQSRNASMLDLAPSGFRDLEDNYDSEELEGIESIVHPDNKSKKQTKSKTDETKLTDEEMMETLKSSTEHKKKERVKGRNEKKSLQGSDAVTTSDSQQSDTTVHVTNNTTTVQHVHTAELLQQASVVMANLQHTSEQSSTATHKDTTDKDTTAHLFVYSAKEEHNMEHKKATEEQNVEHKGVTEKQNIQHKRATKEHSLQHTEEQSMEHTEEQNIERKRVTENQNAQHKRATEEQSMEHTEEQNIERKRVTENQNAQHKRVTEEQSMEHTEEQDMELKKSTVDKYTSQKSSQSATTDARKMSQQRQMPVETTSQVYTAQEKVINQSNTSYSSQANTSSSAASVRTKQAVSTEDNQQARMKVTMEQTVSQITSPTTQAATQPLNTNMSLQQSEMTSSTTSGSQKATQMFSKDLKSAQVEMQATMEQAISQITSPVVTKSAHTAYKQQTSMEQKIAKYNIKDDKPQVRAATKPVVSQTSQDENDSNMLTPSDQKDTETDGGFNALLNELQNLSGSFDISIGSTSTQQQSTDQFQALSLLSDVPIVAPPRSSVISSTSSTDSSKEVTKRSSGISATKSVEVTPLQPTVTPTKPVKPAVVATTVTATPTKPVTPVVVTKPSSVQSKPSTATTTPVKPVTPAIATSTPASHTTVPVAVSHKNEIKQKSDGTDQEWGIDFNDIDMDLASELEELNSILGQLGVGTSSEEQATIATQQQATTQQEVITQQTTTKQANLNQQQQTSYWTEEVERTIEIETTPEVTMEYTAPTITYPESSSGRSQQVNHYSQGEPTPIDSGMIAALGQMNNKISTSSHTTLEEVKILQETRRKVVTNIAEYCIAISKGDKSAALNLALTLSTTYKLDASTISEVNNYINTGVYTDTAPLPKTAHLLVNNGIGPTSSGISLFSSEAEQALLKQQEEHMRVTEEHFKEQAVVQSDLKRQLAAQSQLQQEANRQAVSFVEAQSTQARLLEEAQRQVQEQAERLKMAELKLKEAEYMSREKEMASDRDRILKEAQEQQQRAQRDYEEKNQFIISLQTQFREMQELQQKMMTRFEEQDKQQKQAMAITIKQTQAASHGKGEDSDSDEETMMTAVKPSLQREIMAHAEVRTMEAQIQRNTPLSHRLMAEDGIPGAPPLPNVNMLMDKKKKRNTIKAATTSANVFDKFEKGGLSHDIDEEEDDSDDDELQFARPTMVTSRGTEAKTAIIKHKTSTSSHTVDIPDHGYYRSGYSIHPTTKPPNIRTFDKMPGDFELKIRKVPQ